jgi:hypothetical protein
MKSDGQNDMFAEPDVRPSTAVVAVRPSSSTITNNENTSPERELSKVNAIGNTDPYRTSPECDGNSIVNITSVFEKQPHFASIRL